MSSRLSCNQTAVITIGGSAVWWMLYEVKAGVVYFAAYKLCDLCLSASEASFSQWGAKQIQLPLPFFSFITDTFNTVNNIMQFTPHDMIKCHKWIHVKIRYIYTSVHDMSPVSVSVTHVTCIPRYMYPIRSITRCHVWAGLTGPMVWMRSPGSDKVPAVFVLRWKLHCSLT